MGGVAGLTDAAAFSGERTTFLPVADLAFFPFFETASFFAAAVFDFFGFALENSRTMLPPVCNGFAMTF